MGMGEPRVPAARLIEAGFRQALSGIAEADTFLHLAPSVLVIRERMASEEFKAVHQDYRGPSSMDLIKKMWG
jgi:enoyl-CoA hydratase